MSDKKISQLPIGSVGMNSIFPVVTNGITSQTTLQDISNILASGDKYVTGGTFNSNTGIATFTNTEAGTFQVTGFSSDYRYVTGFVGEKLNGNSVTIGKGKGKLIMTSGNTSFIGIDGADFFDSTSLDSIGTTYEATIILADGTPRFISIDYFDDATTGYINNIYTDSQYNNSIGTIWNDASGVYDYYAYFIPVGTGNYSYSEGFQTQAISHSSHAEGFNSISTGSSSHAEGGYTLAGGNYSHAEGNYTQAIGHRSHTEGYYTIATGDTSHAEGFNSSATTQSSHAEGESTLASGGGSHSEGFRTIASGLASHAGGSGSTASGNYSLVHGSGSTASGLNSIVLGSGIVGTGTNTTYVANMVVKSTYVPTGSTDTFGEFGSIVVSGTSMYFKTDQWYILTGNTF